MKIPSVIKNATNKIFNKFSDDVGSLLIWTTIAGWIASSSAQIIGIAANKKYSIEDKTFMLFQEIGDASANIGSFFAITYPLKKFAIKLGSTGKILPAIIKKELKKHNDLDKVGKLDFDISKLDYIKDSDVFKHYKSFNNFLSTSAAVVGGVISSNIVTPILRNRFAASGQSKVLGIRNNNYRSNLGYQYRTYSNNSPFNYFKNL